MKTHLPAVERTRLDAGAAAPSRAPVGPEGELSQLGPEIEGFLRRQREGIERWSRSAGDVVRSEVERAVLRGLSDAFRRLADELPRLLAGAASLPSPPADETNLSKTGPPPPGVPCFRGPAEAPRLPTDSDGPRKHATLPEPETSPEEPEPADLAATAEFSHDATAELPALPAPVPDAALAALRQGHRHARAEAFGRAVAEYTLAIRLHPDCIEARLGRGQALFRLRHLDRAATDFQEAAGLAPDLAVAPLLLGGVRLAQGRWDEAVAAYTAAVRLDPRQAVAFLNRGLAHSKLGDADRAIADADAALRLNPDLAEAYYLRAVACTRQRKDEQAVADLTWLIERHPNLWRAYYTRGLAHANRGDHDRAVADFGQALRLAPGLLAARFQRGAVYRLKGEYAYAILDLTRFLQARPGSARAWFQRGLAYLADGQHDQAVADFDRAIEREPQNEEARVRRAQALEERDKERDAPAAPTPAAEPPAERTSATPEVPRRIEEAAPSPTALWLTCPACGATAQVSWKRLDRTFKCRGCSRLFHVNADGAFTHVDTHGGRPRRAWPRKRLLASAAGLCVVAVLVGWFFLRPPAADPNPLPHDLKARAELWGKAWISNDRYLLRRLTDSASDRALHPWLTHHHPPSLTAVSEKKDAGPDAEIEACVDRSGEHEAVLRVRIKAPSLKAPVEVRQNWVERGDAWYFVPS